MTYEDGHISDSDLLLYVEGELPSSGEKRVLAHLSSCWRCRARRQELETAIADFVRVYQNGMDVTPPPAAGPRALLKARMSQLSVAPSHGNSDAFRFRNRQYLVFVLVGALTFGLAVFSAAIWRVRSSSRPTGIVSVPDSRLTPGATAFHNRSTVCSQESANNRTVSAAVQRIVLEEYGIAGADPRAYEIDYLVTPALGGADDIHNLWPHSHSSTVWNAQVKDDLENRLRQMVCGGNLDLAEAQREIAGNWIAAYKKYFRTDRPLDQHVQ